MLFNSYEYIFLFLPVTFFVYFYLTQKRLIIASKGFLIFSSLFFYSWWNLVYLPLILVSILFNYVISNLMTNSDENKKIYFSKKSLLQTGLIFNIGLLLYFKYMDFFILNTNIVFNTNFDLFHFALPLAISFFTLQQIAFLFDSYEGLAKEKSFLDYTLFVTFFPQLIAGPIVHHKEMMPQFLSNRNKVINYKNISAGLFIISIGLFKKVVIADSFSVWATAGFDTAPTLNFFAAWATSLSYTFQLYFDFSGYTDMAIGAALLFNIKLPQNFNSPFKATGIIEFWSKWHITLTRFITDYIYTPIIRSFESLTFSKAMIATFIAFLIAGLWHGASWMFVIFGGLHGIGIVVNHYWKKIWKKKLNINLNKYLAWLITFNYVNFTFIFFRATNLDDAIKVLQGMIGLNGIMLPQEFESKLLFLKQYGIEFGSWASDVGSNWIPIIIILSFVILMMKNSMQIIDYPKLQIQKTVIKRQAIFFGILSFITLTSLTKYSEFIYFNF